MNTLLDTCVLSDLVKPRPDKGLLAWMESQDESSFRLSVLTLGELGKGISRLPAGAKRSRLQAWLERDLVKRFSGRILSVDAAVAARWGEIQARAEKLDRPMPVIDGLIAATAAVHSLAVVTRNGADMRQSGLEIIDPWGMTKETG